MTRLSFFRKVTSARDFDKLVVSRYFLKDVEVGELRFNVLNLLVIGHKFVVVTRKGDVRHMKLKPFRKRG